MSTKGTAPWVIIVGAGSSGLLLALLLAKRGITVQVVDMSSKLDEQPRATHYAPPLQSTSFAAQVSLTRSENKASFPVLSAGESSIARTLLA
jgi:2-polyprenyl-6-methoxyphenol hydroxylase-like FAD-dependent oxidoreductase